MGDRSPHIEGAARSYVAAERDADTPLACFREPHAAAPQESVRVGAMRDRRASIADPIPFTRRQMNRVREDRSLSEEAELVVDVEVIARPWERLEGLGRLAH